jgi:hypothetical protein
VLPPRKRCVNEITNDNHNAVQKPSILNPSTISPAMRSIEALITNKNNPMVKSVAGMVKRTSMGFTNLFNNVMTIALMITVTEESTENPSSK